MSLAQDAIITTRLLWPIEDGCVFVMNCGPALKASAILAESVAGWSEVRWLKATVAMVRRPNNPRVRVQQQKSCLLSRGYLLGSKMRAAVFQKILERSDRREAAIVRFSLAT